MESTYDWTLFCILMSAWFFIAGIAASKLARELVKTDGEVLLAPAVLVFVVVTVVIIAGLSALLAGG